MKSKIIFFMFMLCANMMMAQELSVRSFEARASDYPASQSFRKDKKGNDCALVKVQLAAKGALFDGDVIGDVKYDVSEYFVYMPKGSKKLTVKLEGYKPLKVAFKEHRIDALEASTTYVMVLTKGEQEVQRVMNGSLDVSSIPWDADIMIDGQAYGKTPRSINGLQEGEHTVTLTKKGYASVKENFTIRGDETTDVNATLELTGISIHLNKGESLKTKIQTIESKLGNEPWEQTLTISGFFDFNKPKIRNYHPIHD